MVVGTPRSGTTLVQRFVTEECGLRGGPETHFFTKLPLILREAKGPDALRTALTAYARIPQLAGANLDVNRVLQAVGARRSHLYSVFEAVVSQLAGDCTELTEKTPGHLWWWERLTGHDPELKLVVVVRDPRAVVASMRSARFTDMDIALLSEWWRTDQAMAAAAARALGPQRALVVRYEDVVGDEQAVRARLAAFHVGTSSPHDSDALVLPWETWKQGFDQTPAPGRVDAWKSVLTPGEIGTIERVTRREMQHFGYEPVPSTGGRRERRSGTRPIARLRYRGAIARHRYRQRSVTL